MITSNGIVLHTLRYSDAQLIVEIFTEVAGTVSFLVHQGARGSRRNATRASVCQPLTLVEVVWEPRVQSSLQKPHELTLWHPWRQLPFHPVKASMALFLSEFLYRALHREQANAPLFAYMVNALKWFDEAEGNYVNFHIVFLLHLTRFLGFEPNVEDWCEGAFFDLEGACFSIQRPMHLHYLEPFEAALVPKFLRMDVRKMRAVALTGAARSRVLHIVLDFYRLHVPEFPELKSLEVLAEVFRCLR